MYVVCSVGNSEKCPDVKKYHIPSLETEPIIWYLHILSYILDAVGSWQIILPMPNLERTY